MTHDYRDYKDDAFTAPGYYLVHENFVGERLDKPTSYRHPAPEGPYDTIRELAIAERLATYPPLGYIVFYNGDTKIKVPSIDPDDLIQRDPIPDVASDEPDEKGWKRDEISLFDSGTGMGGDNMVGIGYEARYHRQFDDGTFAVITERYFVEDLNQTNNVEPGDENYDPSRYGITNQTEFTHCSDLEDVGGSEISSDYEYEPNYNQPFGSYDDLLTWYENECLRCAAQDGRLYFFYMDELFTLAPTAPSTESGIAMDFNFTVATEQGATYTPWTDGWGIGYKVTAPGQPDRFIFLNPSDADTLGEANCFIYVESVDVSVPDVVPENAICHVTIWGDSKETP